MPVWKPLLVLCLGVVAVLNHDGARAETALAALDLERPAPEPSALECLALNIYWEARSEPLLGQVAVAAVTLNRVAAPAFPDTVCEVVFQGEERGRHLCQFSWRCDGLDDRPRNLGAWQEARRVARLALSDQVPDPTGGALWYHAAHVLPDWSQEMTLRARIGHHVFYDRRPASELAPVAAVQGSGMRAAGAAPEGAGGIDSKPATSGTVRPVPPSPRKPPLTIGQAPASPAQTVFAGLRIDLELDPTEGLLLCPDGAGCEIGLRLEAVRGEDAAVAARDDRHMPELEPGLGGRILGTARSPEASVEPWSLASIDGEVWHDEPSAGLIPHTLQASR